VTSLITPAPHRFIMGATPPGIAALVNARGGRNYSTAVYRTVVLVLTFGSYTLYHATRKPMSIVKGTLRDGWAPFTGEDGNSLLGSIDVAFLATYAVGMFFSGHVADTMDLRVFLTVGMLGSGLFTAVFGLCYFYDVHDVWVFYAIQVPCPLLAFERGFGSCMLRFPARPYYARCGQGEAMREREGGWRMFSHSRTPTDSPPGCQQTT